MFGAAAGDAHSAAVGMDGTVWTWGQARHGQVGDNDVARFLDRNPQNTSPLQLPRPCCLACLDPRRLSPLHR